MRRRIEYRPSKANSAFGLAVGIIFVLIGLFLVIPQFGAFGLFWTLIALVITVMNGINAFSDKGVPTGEIRFEDEEAPPAPPVIVPPTQPSPSPSAASVKTPEERLETLRDLHQQGLITAEEYDRRRREILEEI